MNNAAPSYDYSLNDVVENKFINEERNLLLRNWCNQYRGRTNRLGKLVFDHAQSGATCLSHYKNGRFPIQDWMWNKILDSISVLENQEKNSDIKLMPFKTYSSFKHSTNYKTISKAKAYFNSCPEKFQDFKEFTKCKTLTVDNLFNDVKHKVYIESHFEKFLSVTYNIQYKDLISQWLTTNKDLKIRLANVIYEYNYNNGIDLTKKNFFMSYYRSQNYNINPHFYIYERAKKVMAKVDQMIKENHPFVDAALGLK